MAMASVYSSVVVCNWCNEDIQLKFVDNDGPNWCGKCPAPAIVVKARAEAREQCLRALQDEIDSAPEATESPEGRDIHRGLLIGMNAIRALEDK